MSGIVVVGAGAAGLFTALTAAREGVSVRLISAMPLAATASYWAQGGLAAALAVADSPEAHLADTLAAGRDLVRRRAAEVLCEEAPARFHDLVELGVRFDADRHGNVELGLEGGHSVRRVVHAGGSATGRRILRQLSACVVAEPRIEILEGTRATSLAVDEAGRCAGVFLEDGRLIAGRGVILSSGGTAALWSRTTNPPGSWGSGLLLARAAGAALADLEFIQFHPTAVTGVPGREGFLVTEAIRGEGATLHGPDGERFVDELAPRDAVAKAIHRVMVDTGAAHVELDMRHIDPAHFPNVVEALRAAGLDPTTRRIPVSPAAHYAMGGIVTDLQGRAEGVPGLYAVGEVACTGLHGANRLASNSLSECFVFGRRAAISAAAAPGVDQAALRPAGEAPPAPSRESREAVWRGAGLERTEAGLAPLLDDPHPLVRLVAASALHRRESRGAHARAEHPAADARLDHTHSVISAQASAPRFVTWS